MSNISKSKAMEIACLIADDLQGRRGIGNEWEDIEEEDQFDIKCEWAEIVIEVHNS